MPIKQNHLQKNPKNKKDHVKVHIFWSNTINPLPQILNELAIFSDIINHLSHLCSWVISNTGLLNVQLHVLVGALQFGRPPRAAASVQGAVDGAPRLHSVEQEAGDDAQDAGKGTQNEDHPGGVDAAGDLNLSHCLVESGV